MIVYKIRIAYNKEGDDKYAPMYPKDTKLCLKLSQWQFFGPYEFDDINKCVINPAREKWTEPYGDVWPKRGLEYEYDGKKKRADFHHDMDFSIYTLRAIELLGNYLDPTKGEFLPVHCDERDDLLIYRCLNCLDAIDEEKIIPIPSNIHERHKTPAPKDFKEKINFDYYHFREGVIRDTPMFTVPCHYSTETFVTDRFVERVKELKLKGFGFQPVWSSELGPLCDHCNNPLCAEGNDINL